MSIRDKRRAELEAIAELTLDDLQSAVDRLPSDLRDALAQGPLDSRYACHICKVFHGYFKTADPDLEDPRWIVWNWHEVPKVQMTCAEDQWRGPLAGEVYRRCIETYRAAGWVGPVEPVV